MIKFFVVVATIIGLISVGVLLFFVYRIHRRNESIDCIHYLVSENDKSISNIARKVDKMYATTLKFKKLIDEEIEHNNS